MANELGLLVWDSGIVEEADVLVCALRTGVILGKEAMGRAPPGVLVRGGTRQRLNTAGRTNRTTLRANTILIERTANVIGLLRKTGSETPRMRAINSKANPDNVMGPRLYLPYLAFTN